MRYQPTIRRGRALRDAAGDLLVAPSRRTSAWRDAARSEVDLDPAVAARWLRDAELEHASVASFAQLALALMACGAPPELVAAAHESALDEIRHARICYSLASSYAGEPLGPGPLEPPPIPSGDAVALALETFVDGCIGETTAALVAARSAEGCELPAVRDALESIARDEERHALLAWRILRFTLRFDGVRDAIAGACERLVAEAVPDAREPDRLASYGLLSGATERRIRHEVVQGVVLPCARALLDA